VAPPAPFGELGDLGDVAGLRALGTVNDLEFDRLALLERPEPLPWTAEKCTKTSLPPSRSMKP
jgi:hypothetical protein